LNFRSLKVAIVALAVAIPVMISFQAGNAQVKKGKTRTATTHDLMESALATPIHGISDGLKDAGPADDKAWGKVRVAAALLNEMGYGLMDDGRCPDGVWAEACKQLREGSAKLIAAAEAKNLTDAREALKLTGASCATCHKAHKK
jgi:hypothetical protein